MSYRRTSWASWPLGLWFLVPPWTSASSPVGVLGGSQSPGCLKKNGIGSWFLTMFQYIWYIFISWQFCSKFCSNLALFCSIFSLLFGAGWHVGASCMFGSSRVFPWPETELHLREWPQNPESASCIFGSSRVFPWPYRHVTWWNFEIDSSDFVAKYIEFGPNSSPIPHIIEYFIKTKSFCGFKR